MSNVRIDVFSDVVCPWCYLGRARFDLALARLDFADDLDVRWRAYQLDPTATAEPKDLRAAIERKYGPGAFDSMQARLTALGADLGLDYRFDLAQRVTSVPALRLAAWVEATAGRGVAEQLHDRLFRAYFTEGANIADPASLADWAVEVGVDRTLAEEAIATGAGADAVDADLQQARTLGITGVPSFVIEQRHVIPGAQDVDTLVNLLTRIHAKLTSR